MWLVPQRNFVASWLRALCGDSEFLVLNWNIESAEGYRDSVVSFFRLGL